MRKFVRAVGDVFATDLYVRWATLVVLAASVAYYLADLTNFSSPSIAALMAGTLVQGTVHETVKESLLQLAGAVLGISLGVGIWQAWGDLNFFALPLAMVGGFLFARMAHLNIRTAISMNVPVIVVVAGHNITTTTVEQRISGIAIGAGVALLASYATKSGKPTHRVVRDLQEINTNVAETLNDIASCTQRGKLSREKIEEWSEQAQTFLNDVVEVRDSAEEIVSGAKFTPFVKKKEAEKTVRQADIALVSVTTLTAMVETLAEVCERQHSSHHPHASDSIALSSTLSSVLPEQLEATADVIAHHTPTVSPSGIVHEPVVVEQSSVGVAETVGKEVAKRIKNVDETQELILGTSLLAGTQHITHTITAGTETAKKMSDTEQSRKGSSSAGLGKKKRTKKGNADTSAVATATSVRQGDPSEVAVGGEGEDGAVSSVATVGAGNKMLLPPSRK